MSSGIFFAQIPFRLVVLSLPKKSQRSKSKAENSLETLTTLILVVVFSGLLCAGISIFLFAHVPAVLRR